MTVDQFQVARFLMTRFANPVSGISRLGHGEWSTAYAYTRNDQEEVIRFGAHLDDFARDRFAAQFASPVLPVPAILELGEAFGQHYAISERASGDYLDDLSGAAMQALLPSLFRTLDAIRVVDLSATTGFGSVELDGNARFSTWSDYLLDAAIDRPGERVGGWREALAASSTGAATLEAALAMLADLHPHIPEHRYLVHSDLLNYNVLAEDDRISAVLDWGCAFYGDFLYDVAWFIYWAPVYPAWTEIDFAAEAEKHYREIGLDVPLFRERLQVCLLHIGIGDQIYNTFKQRWDRLAAGARRTKQVMDGDW